VPESLNETVLAGETKTVSFSFTASEDLGAVEIRMVPELEPFVRTEPTSFTSITAGQTTTLDITISAPADASPQVVEGTIQIRNAGRPPRNFARSLPVSVEVVRPLFSDDQLGLTIEYPPTWIIRPGGRTTVFSNVSEPGELTEAALQTESFFEIRLHDEVNPDTLPINRWFDEFFSDGFAVDPLSRTSIMVGGRDSVRIETSEIGRRVHIYVPNQTDVVEIVYGLFAEQFIDEYEAMLNSLQFSQ
jgi:hypothetical protein